MFVDQKIDTESPRSIDFAPQSVQSNWFVLIINVLALALALAAQSHDS
jgi:hypothetical protein